MDIQPYDAEMTKKRIRLFFLLTFGIAWGIPGFTMLAANLTDWFEFSMERFSVLSYLAIWAPAISAFSIIMILNGWQGVKSYLLRLLNWGNHAGWLLAVLLGIPVLNLISCLVLHLLGADALIRPQMDALPYLITILLVFSQGPIEEFGWRGYALPLLQRHNSGLVAAIFLGFIWMLWHVPALFIECVMTGALDGSIGMVILRLFIGGIANTIIMTVIYNGSGGSLPLMILFHGLNNLPYPWEGNSGINPAQDVISVLIAILLIFVFGKRYLGRKNLFTTPLGEKMKITVH